MRELGPAPDQLALDQAEEALIDLLSAGAVALLSQTEPGSSSLPREMCEEWQPVAHARGEGADCGPRRQASTKLAAGFSRGNGYRVSWPVLLHNPAVLIRALFKKNINFFEDA